MFWIDSRVGALPAQFFFNFIIDLDKILPKRNVHFEIAKAQSQLESQVAALIEQYSASAARAVASDDPAVKVLGAIQGQVLRIERDSLTSGSSYYYRLVD